MIALLNSLTPNRLAAAGFGDMRLDFNKIESQHIAIAIAGMVIVFTALLLVSLAIAILPKILDRLGLLLPPETSTPSAGVQATSAASDDGEVLAAIGLALHYHHQRQA